MSEEKTTQRFGGFEIIGSLGVGGAQGSVKEARCLEPDPDLPTVTAGMIVALKIMKPEDLGGDSYRQLKKRTAALEQIKHPNVVSYYGCFERQEGFEQYHVVVMECLRGCTLRDKLQRAPRGLDVDVVVRIFRECIAGLAAAVNRQIIHRDIKPSNIFLCDNGTTKLIDFELARHEAASHTGAGQGSMRGTINYMAPEFHPALKPDPAFRGDAISDIFSLCVCLYEALSGHLPYENAKHSTFEDDMMAFFTRWGGAPDAKSSLVNIHKQRALHPLVHIEGVLEKGLTVRRNERFANVAALQQRFERVKPREIASTANHYTLLQVIGHGGFAEVFKARRERDGLLVAIKLLTASAQSARFVREARVLEDTVDPRIVRFIEFIVVSKMDLDRHFLVMELLPGMPGGSLRDRLDQVRHIGLAVPEVLQIFARYAQALAILHQRQILHRDIKPANLYAPADNPNNAKIMDLGIARDENAPTMTRRGIPGTPDYWPPEVMTPGFRGDSRMDIYALGLCLFEALTGDPALPRLPRQDDLAYQAFLERARSRPLPPLHDRRIAAHPRLQQLLRRMLDPEPANRIGDAEQVARTLNAIRDTLTHPALDAEPVTVHTSPSSVRAISQDADIPIEGHTRETVFTESFPGLGMANVHRAPPPGSVAATIETAYAGELPVVTSANNLPPADATVETVFAGELPVALATSAVKAAQAVASGRAAHAVRSRWAQRLRRAAMIVSLLAGVGVGAYGLRVYLLEKSRGDLAARVPQCESDAAEATTIGMSGFVHQLCLALQQCRHGAEREPHVTQWREWESRLQAAAAKALVSISNDFVRIGNTETNQLYAARDNWKACAPQVAALGWNEGGQWSAILAMMNRRIAAVENEAIQSARIAASRAGIIRVESGEVKDPPPVRIEWRATVDAAWATVETGMAVSPGTIWLRFSRPDYCLTNAPQQVEMVVSAGESCIVHTPKAANWTRGPALTILAQVRHAINAGNWDAARERVLRAQAFEWQPNADEWAQCVATVEKHDREVQRLVTALKDATHKLSSDAAWQPDLLKLYAGADLAGVRDDPEVERAVSALSNAVVARVSAACTHEPLGTRATRLDAAGQILSVGALNSLLGGKLVADLSAQVRAEQNLFVLAITNMFTEPISVTVDNQKAANIECGAVLVKTLPADGRDIQVEALGSTAYEATNQTVPLTRSSGRLLTFRDFTVKRVRVRVELPTSVQPVVGANLESADGASLALDGTDRMVLPGSYKLRYSRADYVPIVRTLAIQPGQERVPVEMPTEAAWQPVPELALMRQAAVEWQAGKEQGALKAMASTWQPAWSGHSNEQQRLFATVAENYTERIKIWVAQVRRSAADSLVWGFQIADPNPEKIVLRREVEKDLPPPAKLVIPDVILGRLPAEVVKQWRNPIPTDNSHVSGCAELEKAHKIYEGEEFPLETTKLLAAAGEAGATLNAYDLQLGLYALYRCQSKATALRNDKGFQVRDPKQWATTLLRYGDDLRKVEDNVTRLFQGASLAEKSNTVALARTRLSDAEVRAWILERTELKRGY